MGGGGGGDTVVQAPVPSQEEKDLQKQQLDILKAQQADDRLLRPWYLKSMGLVEENGQLRQMTEAERMASLSATERQQANLQTLALQQQLLSSGYKMVQQSDGSYMPVPMTDAERLAAMSPEQKTAYEQSKQMNALQSLSINNQLKQSGYAVTYDADGQPVLKKLTDQEVLASMTPEEQKQYTLNQTLYNQAIQRMGYDPTSGAKLSEEQYVATLTPAEQRDYQISKAAALRSQQALEGTLPVSPALEKEITDQKTELETYLEQKLGTNWRESTPGIQALDAFNQRVSLLREEARRGQMTTAEGISLARSEQDKRSTAQNMGYLGGIAKPNYVGQISALRSMNPAMDYASMSNTYGSILNSNNAQDASMYSAFPQRTQGIFQGYSSALQPYQYYAGLQNQANIANAQASAQRSSGMWGGLGTMLGGIGGAASGAIIGKMMSTTAAVAPLAVASTVRYKDNICPMDNNDIISNLTPVQYISKLDGKQHYGFIAEDVCNTSPELVFMQDGKAAGIYYNDIIAPLVKVVQEMRKEIQQLRGEV